VVIDPQRAFVDPAGSLMRAHGPDELRPGIEAFGRLRAHLAQGSDAASVVFVRSEYRPGQFTAGRLDDPMAHVCVPGANVDCEWAAGLDPARAGAIVTKHQADAAETEAYRAVIAQAVARGVRDIVLAGFQYTTCVRSSALSTVALVRGTGVRVAIAEDLTGARASSYVRTNGLSRLDRARGELRAAGIDIVTGSPNSGGSDEQARPDV
jgi:nicotinamidase-related amidase